MILSKSYDVEILPNFFSITIIDVNDYLRIFNDACEINNKGKRTPIPLIQKYTVSEIKEKLDTVKYVTFYITDEDDSQLLPMISYLNEMRAHRDDKNIAIRTDMFGYNSMGYDKLMVAALLMFATNVNSTRELITKLYEISKKIIELQDKKDIFYKDYFMKSLSKYDLPYVDIDVMRVFALNKCGKGKDKDGNMIYFPKSLKQTSINLQWYELLEYKLPNISDKDVHFYHKNPKYRSMSVNQLQTLIDKWDRFIIPEWIPSMLYYNKNDGFIVCEIIRLNIDEIRTRYNISKAYEVNVLNSSRSNISDVLFEKFYSEFSGLAPFMWKGKKTERTIMAFNKVIFPHIKFKTKVLQDALNEMKKVVITSVSKDAFKKVIRLGELDYTIATGGLHTKDVPRVLKSKLIYNNPSTGDCSTTNTSNTSIWDKITDDSYIYIHWDIVSFYPWIMAMYNVCPAHLNEGVFVKLITWLATARMEAKHSKDAYIDGIIKDVFVLVLKIIINSIYGYLGYERGDLYDRLAVLKVTINGQLMIMMLCEELELNGIEIVSANTDGLVIKLYKKQKALFDDISNRWKTNNKLMADSEEYEYYINRDINNYFIREFNGNITYKGALNPKMYLADLQKGYDMPIVAQAVVNYFLYDKPVLETLHECKNILDFCKTQNVGRQYHVGYIPTNINNDDFIKNFTEITEKDNKTVIEIQRYVRYYVSTNGGILQKIHNIDKSISRLSSGQKVTICNSLDDTRIEYRNINYTYYYNECLKIIDPIKLGISPNQKGNAAKGTKSGKALIAKKSGMYNSLFEDE